MLGGDGSLAGVVLQVRWRGVAMSAGRAAVIWNRFSSDTLRIAALPWLSTQPSL